MVGTSTGGILALSLARPGVGSRAQFSAKQVVKLYEDHSAKIFEHSLWRTLRTADGTLEEACSHKNLEELLEQYFAGSILGAC